MSDEKLAEQKADEYTYPRWPKKTDWDRPERYDGLMNYEIGFEVWQAYCDGFLAGLKAEREKSKKLVEALKHITTCVERNDEHETAKISNYHRLKDARHTSERALKEYEKEGAE